LYSSKFGTIVESGRDTVLDGSDDGLVRSRNGASSAEDEIADRVEAVFALDESLREALEAPLPEAKRTYYDVFTGMDVWDQLRVQANAERQGAQAWRNIASRTSDQRVIDEMATCSALEEASADRLDALIATHAP
jgi:hypothetical protein